ncbi:histone deacetylase family protein [Roseibium aestuarii]|uniref:Histone deacetylase n=1 Tax=Roseibium aestuarii TaxID=2600299 RepID=A0ABW4JWJ6_9HYPH|nr:histone deacetylase [Roseibium aestuarii]
MTLPIVHHPAYCATLPEGHRFPMDKFRALAARLVGEGLVAAGGFVKPRPAPFEWLALAHDPAYVDAVIGCKVPAAIAREIGFPIKEDVSLRARCATGGTVLTGYLALNHGLAANTAGGSHHARRRQGAGFCVFNDVAVAIRVMQADGVIGRALVVDLDVHQGDGTAEIFSGDPSVVTLSLHARRNYPVRKVPSTLDLDLEDGLEDEAYLDALALALERVLEMGPFDITFYNAGVDPWEGDRLGRLSLSREGLARRDRLVISRLRAAGLPVAGVLGGGYSTDMDELSDRHATLHRVMHALSATERPGASGGVGAPGADRQAV